MSVVCPMCRDLGIVEVTDGKVKSLALCQCSFGKDQTWALPVAPVSGYEAHHLPAHLFKTKFGSEEMREKINWWHQRIKDAEEFWKQVVA